MRSKANIILWGLLRSFSTPEIRAKLSNLGLGSFVAGKVRWEVEHVRLVLTAR